MKKIAADGPAGCIVSDVRMPCLSRLELQTLLNKTRCKEPLLLITSFATIDTAVSSMAGERPSRHR